MFFLFHTLSALIGSSVSFNPSFCRGTKCQMYIRLCSVFTPALVVVVRPYLLHFILLVSPLVLGRNEWRMPAGGAPLSCSPSPALCEHVVMA